MRTPFAPLSGAILFGSLLLAGCGETTIDPAAAQAVADEAATLYDGNDWLGSAETYAEAVAMAEEIGREDLAMAWKAQSGIGLKMAGDTAAARPLFLESMAWARANDDAEMLGLSLGNMARVESIDGDYASALGWMDEVADLAREKGNGVLEVKTLDQAGVAALSVGDVPGALARYRRALQVDAGLPEADRKHGELLRSMASARVAARDDEGAAALWRQSPKSAAGTARQARHVGQLGLHTQAAELAREAAALFEEQGGFFEVARDRALLLAVSSLLRAGELDACEELLDVVTQGHPDALALAPYQLVRGRLALARQQWAEAAGIFAGVRALSADLEDGDLAAWLETVALTFDSQFGPAHVSLDRLDDGEVRRWLRAWVVARERPAASDETDALLADVLPALEPDPAEGVDPAVRLLRNNCPVPLPSLAHVSLEAYLVKAAVQRERDDDEGARATVAEGVRVALLWQAMEMLERVDPAARVDLSRRERLDAWIAGGLPADRAIVALISGDSQCYLLICTDELGATTISLPPRFALRRAATNVVNALRTDDTGELVAMSRKLFDLMFPKTAQADLAGKGRWTLILPDDMTSVPPALLVPRDPVPGEPVPWLVRTHMLGLLPHALAGGDAMPAIDAEGGWRRFATPAIDIAGMPLAGTAILGRYGRAVGDAAAVPVGTADLVVEGEEATAARLREDGPGADLLELGVPAAGGGRLGGLILAPSGDDVVMADWGDEALGFVPWHRFAVLDMPPSVLLTHSRFDPADLDYGAAYAATALMQSADAVLMTRWPMPQTARRVMIEGFSRAVRAGIPFSAAITAAQRLYLEQAETLGAPAAAHPRAWAAWLCFGQA